MKTCTVAVCRREICVGVVNLTWKSLTRVDGVFGIAGLVVHVAVTLLTVVCVRAAPAADPSWDRVTSVTAPAKAIRRIEDLRSRCETFPKATSMPVKLKADHLTLPGLGFAQDAFLVGGVACGIGGGAGGVEARLDRAGGIECSHRTEA